MERGQETNIIRKVLAGDVNAFEALVTEYERTVYTLALRMTGNGEDAADITQETFIKAYSSLGSFRGDCRFAAWLYRICSNLCLDFIRARSRRPTVSLSVEDDEGEESQLDIPDETFSPELITERTLTREAVRRGLDSLAPEYRQILLMREIQGLTYDEIGRALSLEEGTVKSRIFRARKRLCAFLRRDGNIYGLGTSSNIRGGERP